MEIKNSFVSWTNKLKYHLEFLRHTKSVSNHYITNEDKRLRKVILQNYLKSFTIANLLALYVNYISKNKSFIKTLSTHLIFSLISFAFTFHFNQRLHHLDFIFKEIDPNLIVNSSNLSEKTKENVKFKIFQFIAIDELNRDCQNKEEEKYK